MFMAKNEIIAIFKTYIAIIKKSKVRLFVILYLQQKSMASVLFGTIGSINYLREV